MRRIETDTATFEQQNDSKWTDLLADDWVLLVNKKTDEMHIDAVILQGLKDWKQLTQFSGPDDWMFASPSQIGRLPISYSGIWQALRTAAAKAGIGHISSHTFRHTHRSWLDAVGTSLGVQQKLMRHADIRTTMQYGTAASADMQQAHVKVVRLALRLAYWQVITAGAVAK